MAKKKKKKGRPSLLDLQKRSIKKQNQQKLLLQRQDPKFSNPRGRKRESVAGDEEDERRKKKHKLLLGFNSGSDPNLTTLSFDDDPDVLLNHDAVIIISEDSFDFLFDSFFFLFLFQNSKNAKTFFRILGLRSQR